MYVYSTVIEDAFLRYSTSLTALLSSSVVGSWPKVNLRVPPCEPLSDLPVSYATPGSAQYTHSRHRQAVKACVPLGAVGSSRRVKKAKVADLLLENPAIGYLISAYAPDGIKQEYIRRLAKADCDQTARPRFRLHGHVDSDFKFGARFDGDGPFEMRFSMAILVVDRERLSTNRDVGPQRRISLRRTEIRSHPRQFRRVRRSSRGCGQTRDGEATYSECCLSGTILPVMSTPAFVRGEVRAEKLAKGGRRTRGEVNFSKLTSQSREPVKEALRLLGPVKY